MLKTWTRVVLLNLALTAAGLRAWRAGRSSPPWPTVPEDESLNFELGVDAQCQEMPLADGADFGVPGRARLRWSALVGECGVPSLQSINYNPLIIRDLIQINPLHSPPLIESLFLNRNPLDCRRRPWTGKPSVNPESGSPRPSSAVATCACFESGGADCASGTRARPGCHSR